MEKISEIGIRALLGKLIASSGQRLCNGLPAQTRLLASLGLAIKNGKFSENSVGNFCKVQNLKNYLFFAQQVQSVDVELHLQDLFLCFLAQQGLDVFVSDAAFERKVALEHSPEVEADGGLSEDRELIDLEQVPHLLHKFRFFKVGFKIFV